MALNGLLDIELSVPNPAELSEFWERRGMLRTADGVLGTADRAVQMRIEEADTATCPNCTCPVVTRVT